MNRILRTVLMFFGILVLVASGLLWLKISPILPELDPKFVSTYLELASRLLETQDLGLAMIKTVPVQPGLTPEDVVESIKSLAVSRNLLFTGESPFHKHVEAVTGEPYRYTNFLSFCDAKVGKMMVTYKHAYAGFMPCRIALVEDKDGKLWLHTMNLELMIHGGRELPPEVKEGALRVWYNIQFIMNGASKGEF